MSSQTHHTRLPLHHHPIPHPHGIRAHGVRHHDVRGQPVPHDGDVLRARDARLRVRAEVLHDLRAAAGLLGGVRQHRDAGGRLDGAGEQALGVHGGRAGGVGDDEKTAARVGGFETLEVLLGWGLEDIYK